MKSITFTLSFFFFFISSVSSKGEKYRFTTSIQKENITIVRDSFGVPHIFAKTDAEAAYGLAWANAEDGFELMQELLLSAKGMMGKVKGKNGAPVDFFLHAIKAKEFTAERFEKDLTPEFKKYLEGYCLAINEFAKKYPERVLLKKAFPITPHDVIQAYVLSFSALTGVAGRVGDVVAGKFDNQFLELPFENESENLPLGSNAYAMNHVLTQDGNTYLCINPHFMIEGPLSFYEAHISSEEGLNITGAIFQGGTSVFMGNNEHLGWAHTYNYFDGVDVYALKMHHKKKTQYELDESFYKLQKRPIWLKVKVKKWLTVPVKRTTFWSEHHGMVLKSKGGNYFAVRAMAFKTVKAAQQFYYMNKARNFDEFKAALSMQGLALFNIVYADKEGNIYYLSNGLIPDRKEEYDWKKLVPGNESKYLWSEAIPVDSLPFSLNPECGFVFNTNNTPFNATCIEENDERMRLPYYVDGRPGENNRSSRFMELVNAQPQFDFEDFKKIKFDNQWPSTSPFLESLKPMYALNPDEHPHIADVIQLAQTWDKKADTASLGATVIGLMLEPLFKEKMDEPFITGLNVEQADFVKAFEYVKNHLEKHFGTVNVRLGQLQRFVRGEKEYAVPGFPDALMANYPRKPHKNGSFKLEYGDTFIQFVKFNKNGVEKIESLLPFSTLPTAENYIDQTLMYQQKQIKSTSLNKEEVMKKALRIYHP